MARPFWGLRGDRFNKIGRFPICYVYETIFDRIYKRTKALEFWEKRVYPNRTPVALILRAQMDLCEQKLREFNNLNDSHGDLPGFIPPKQDCSCPPDLEKMIHMIEEITLELKTRFEDEDIPRVEGRPQ